MSRGASKAAEVISYWPHAGIGLGLALNVAGLMTGKSELIGTGSNVLTICGLFLAQRRRNAKRDEA
jgi:hypothetical protein